MKRIYIIFLLAIAFSLNGFCGSFSIPHDVPTVEALIDLHKTMAKYEEQSKKQEISSTQSNAHHTKVAQKWHDVRDTINSKLDIANQLQSSFQGPSTKNKPSRYHYPSYHKL